MQASARTDGHSLRYGELVECRSKLTEQAPGEAEAQCAELARAGKVS